MNEYEKKAKVIVVMAASSGGVNALTQVLSHLPSDLPAAILFIQHLTADRRSGLPEHLQRHCRLLVRLAQDGLPVAAGVVYMAVPGQHLRIKEGRLILDSGEPVNYVCPSADVLFASVAEAYGNKVVGVVLTGAGRDGAHGCQKIKESGGMTIVQNETTSEQFGMPKAAVNTGAVDYVLPLEQIPSKITTLVQGIMQEMMTVQG